MNAQDVVQLIREGIFVLLIIGAPTMLVSLIVGLIISLIQALTQIQEMTLTFVPKVIAMLLTLVISLPFMIDRLNDFAIGLYDRIAHIED